MEYNYSIKVAVLCTAYNHEPYLRQCLDGFISQKTNFKFIAIVHDDVSTDNTVAIIKEYAGKYPDIIKPIYETENQYSKHDGYLDRVMIEKAISYDAKYIAMCEGDDYWIDPYKLQKQVDFLDTHDDCYLCYHACKNLFERDFVGAQIPLCETVKPEYTYEDLLKGYQFQTATIMYRSTFYITDIYKVISHREMFSMVIFLALSQFGRVMGINEQMSVYRRNNGGITLSNAENLSTGLIKNLINLSNSLSNDKKSLLHAYLVKNQLVNLYFHSKEEYKKIMLDEEDSSPSMANSIRCKVLELRIKRAIKNIFHREK